MRVIAVVVSFNRRELLKETLGALSNQTRRPDAVIVVDNASTDGADEVAARLVGEDDLIRLRVNTGGAGGFAVGMAAALARDADWIWVMDDDTVPTEGALAALVDSVERHARPGLIGAVGSRVLWTDGSLHPMNTPRPKPRLGPVERDLSARIGAMPVRSISFVSSMFRAETVAAVGLPVVDYFLWNDDFEFSARLLRRRLGIVTPASMVVHKTRVAGSTDADPGERFYFEVRNKVWLFTRSSALGAGDRLLYGGSSLLRWARTVRRSSRRRVLLSGLFRGLRDGFLTAPRSNGAALTDAGLSVDLRAVVDRTEPTTTLGWARSRASRRTT